MHRYPMITVKNAYITSRLNKYFPERHYDYYLKLDKRMYNKLNKLGLNVKTLETPDGENIYFIKVAPSHEFENLDLRKMIAAPTPDMFLEKNDIDITFKIYTCEFNGRTLTKLYFSKSGISKSGEEEE